MKTGTIVLIAYGFAAVVCGVMCETLATRKGYNSSRQTFGYFIIGFLFSFLGLMYVGFLPEDNDQFIEKVRSALEPKKKTPERSDFSPTLFEEEPHRRRRQ